MWIFLANFENESFIFGSVRQSSGSGHLFWSKGEHQALWIGKIKPEKNLNFVMLDEHFSSQKKREQSGATHSDGRRREKASHSVGFETFDHGHCDH